MSNTSIIQEEDHSYIELNNISTKKIIHELPSSNEQSLNIISSIEPEILK